MEIAERRINVVENKLKKWRTGSRKLSKRREKRKKRILKSYREKYTWKTDGIFSYAFRRWNNLKHIKNIQNVIQENYSEI